jgi:hypothetical protein
VELDSIELRTSERAGLVPDRVRYGGRAEIVHERGPAECGDGNVTDGSWSGWIRPRSRQAERGAV